MKLGAYFQDRAIEHRKRAQGHNRGQGLSTGSQEGRGPGGRREWKPDGQVPSEEQSPKQDIHQGKER